jgi:serine/threonine-protein kinase RsbW
MAGDYRLDGLAVPDSLESLHQLLDRVRADHPALDADDVMLFETAVVEIHGNVVQHGRPHGEVRYVFELDVDGNRLDARLSTESDEVPGLADRVENAHAVDVESESGRGLWMADSMLDELTYRREGTRDVWEMVKTVRAVPTS